MIKTERGHVNVLLCYFDLFNKVKLFKTHETSSEYIRDLIRRDMENEHYKVYAQITEGFRDFAEGRLLESTGDFERDMKLLHQREAEEWK